MSGRLSRVDPFWFRHPALGALALAAGLAGFAALTRANLPVAGACAAVFALAVLLATKPALSATFGALGLLGGAASFLLAARPGVSPLLRLVSTVAFGLMYAVLLDALVLAAAVLYNFFTAKVGLAPVTYESGD